MRLCGMERYRKLSPSHSTGCTFSPKDIPPNTINTQQIATNTGPAAPVSLSAQCSTLLKHRITSVPEFRISGISRGEYRRSRFYRHMLDRLSYPDF